MWHPLHYSTDYLHRREKNTGLIYETPQDSDNGSFIFPRVWPADFREAATINISWSTNYGGINLYYYQRGKVAESVQIASNLAMEWLLWEVGTEETNLTDPFVFRIVDAGGTEDEQLDGGFWSSSFFIIRDATSDTTVSPTPTVSAITPIQSSPSSTSPPPTRSSTESTPSSTNLSSPSSATTQAIESGGSGLSSGAIAGISIGIAIAVVALAAIGFWYGRRRRGARDRPDHHRHQPDESPPKPRPPTKLNSQMPPPELYITASGLYEVRVFHELPANEVVMSRG